MKKISFKHLDEMNDEIFHAWIGLNKTDFNDILSHLIVNIDQPKQVLALYFSRLHTGESLDRLALLFNIPSSTSYKYFQEMSESIHNYFYPLHMNNWNRDKIKYFCFG